MIHGLDADLFMLSVLQSDKNIYLYREYDSKPTYLSISHFVKNLKTKHPSWSALDYVTLSFLMGNDFLPKHYALNLRQNALTLVLEIHEKVRSQLGHDMIQNGVIHKTFLLKVLQECANMEDMLVKKRAETTVYKNLMKHGHSPQDRFHYWPDYHRNIEIGINFGNPGWREKYYESIGSTEEHIPHMCKEYINGLAWNLKYYTSNDPTQECDQSWYYPYSHAPLLKDLVLYLETHPITLPNSKKEIYFIRTISNSIATAK